MTTNPVELNFVQSKCSELGYDVDGVPDQYGVYLVASVNKTGIDPIYIGKAKSLNERLSNHEKYESFVENIKKGDSLEIHFATISKEKIDRIEQALIYKFQPILNTDHLNDFNYQDTTITITGSIKHNKFTVKKTT